MVRTMMSLIELPLSFMGLETTALTLVGYHVIPLRRHCLNYGLEKPKLSFLKSLGVRRLYEKVSGLSSNPKRIKCIFIGHPKQLGIPPVSDPKAIGIASRIGFFLEERFLSKELSGRMVET